MEGHKHFSHPHALSLHQILVGATLTCTGCKLPCTTATVYSCHRCKFFLHQQCFDSTRSLIHPSHPDHPLSLFPCPTYTSGSFVCNSCNETGSGFCFSCAACEFDLHIHCASSDLNPKPHSNPPPNQIKLKSHPNHTLKYFHKSAYTSGSYLCDVCGTTSCDSNGAFYSCDICDYVVHIECASLSETVHREDHEHALSLLYVNPNSGYVCDVCRGTIERNNCMYICTSGCDYGIHVKCVSNEVSEEAPMFDFDMSKLWNKMREYMQSYWALAIVMVIIAIITVAMSTRDKYDNRYYYSGRYCDNNHCIVHNRIGYRQ